MLRPKGSSLGLRAGSSHLVSKQVGQGRGGDKLKVLIKHRQRRGAGTGRGAGPREEGRCRAGFKRKDTSGRRVWRQWPCKQEQGEVKGAEKAWLACRVGWDRRETIAEVSHRGPETLAGRMDDPVPTAPRVEGCSGEVTP